VTGCPPPPLARIYIGLVNKRQGNAYATAAACSHPRPPLIDNPDTPVLITSMCWPRPRSPYVALQHSHSSFASHHARTAQAPSRQHPKYSNMKRQLFQTIPDHTPEPKRYRVERLTCVVHTHVYSSEQSVITAPVQRTCDWCFPAQSCPSLASVRQTREGECGQLSYLVDLGASPSSSRKQLTNQVRLIRFARIDERKYEGAAQRTCAVKQVFCIELKALRASDTSGLVVSEETSVVF